ncbi:MAG: tRNA glutamyl-Q(34) synthetase GluQRS [Alphaproteobacteria bacterium]
MQAVTRFAPSPTGRLHVGHAYAALFAWGAAKLAGGRFLLRIEDIDGARSTADSEEAILADLAWLGLQWETPVRRQSEHFEDYREALARLADMNLLYPCFCTRAEIRAEIERSGAAPHHRGDSPEGPIYPGTCRRLEPAERQRRIDKREPHALRLHVKRAVRLAGPLSWTDRLRGEQAATPEIFGDIVLARKDVPCSYHLAVTIDDALQGVTLVTRGEDLLFASHIHRLLQALLGLASPEYHHHELITDAAGNRLAKRDKSISIEALREAGKSPAEVIAMSGFGD